MQFYVATDGSIIKTIPSNVHQGSSGVNKIYFIGAFSSANQITVSFTTPDNIWHEPDVMTSIDELQGVQTESGENYSAWVYTLQSNITSYVGTVNLQFAIYDGENVLTTANTQFQVQKGVPEILPEIPTQSIYQSILSNIALLSNQVNDKLDKKFTSGKFAYTHNGNTQGETAITDTASVGSEALITSGGVHSIKADIDTRINDLSSTKADKSDVDAKLQLKADKTELAQQITETKEYAEMLSSSASANFRGNWANWTSVPQNESYYPADSSGNHTPKTNDYLTVANASDYHDEERFTTQDATNGYKIGESGILSEDSSYAYTKLITIDLKDEYIRFSVVGTGTASTYTVHGYTESGVWVKELARIDIPDSSSDLKSVLVKIPFDVKAIRISYYRFNTNIAVATEQLVGVWRFKYVGTWATDGKDGFMPEYQVNEEPFTQAQQDAINSGATAEKISSIDNKVNKYTGTGSRVYTSSNGVDGTITFASSPNANTIAYRTTNGRLKVGTPVNSDEATTKSYVDTAVAGAGGGMTIGCTSSEYCGYYIPELSMGIDIQDAYLGMEAGKPVQYYDSTRNIYYTVVSAKKLGDATLGYSYKVAIACGNYSVIEYTYGTDFTVSRTFAFIRNGVDSTQPSDIIVEVEPETERNLGVVDGYMQIIFRNTSNEPNPIWSIDFTTNSNEPSITLSGLTIKWVGGEPTFEASKGYTIMVKKVGSTYIGVWGDYEL